MPLYQLADDLPDLRGAVLIASFDGWVDAAEAASRAVDHVAADGRVVATFDPDAVFDYRSRRPVLDVQDGRLSELRWPELAIRHTTAGRHNLLTFSGAEPDLRWQELAADAVTLVRDLGVAQWVSLGAVPGAVAHTRPVPVMVTASEEGLLHPGESAGPEGLLRVPSAVLSVLELAVTGAGTPAVGFYAQVPPYASIGYTAASLALIDRLARHLDISSTSTSSRTRSASSARATTPRWPATRCCARRWRGSSRPRATSTPSNCPRATNWPARSSASCAARAIPATRRHDRARRNVTHGMRKPAPVRLDGDRGRRQQLDGVHGHRRCAGEHS